MIKPENYIVIPGWVPAELNLKGNDAIVYSIIYGFCQIEGHCFCGSINYLAEWTNSTRQGITRNLTNLEEMGLIRKEYGKPTNRYYVTNVTKKYIPSGEDDNDVENLTDNVRISDKQSKQNLDNNINNNINNKEVKQKKYTKTMEENSNQVNVHLCINQYVKDEDIKNSLLKWYDYVGSKKKLCWVQINDSLSKLMSECKNNMEVVNQINISYMYGYSQFYPPKKETSNEKFGNSVSIKVEEELSDITF